MTELTNLLLPPKLKQAKVAIVYDRANINYGGGEQVALAFSKLLPQAVLITSVCDQKQALWTKSFSQIQTTFLNQVSFLRSKHRWLLPFMPIAFESINLSEFDLIISITSAEAKGVITRANQLHLCYLLSPPKYLYQYQDEYLHSYNVIKVHFINRFTKQILKYLSWWDQAASHRPDGLIALSQAISQLAGAIYRMPRPQVIYPPIDMIDLSARLTNQEWQKLMLPNEYDLVVSRLVFYKRVDLAIKTAIKMGRNLVIVGDGPHKKRLMRLATRLSVNNHTNIIFLGSQSQQAVNSITEHAKLFLSLGIDDFGLAPIQANLLGKVAVVHQQSGVTELLLKLNTCQTISSFSIKDVERAINRASSKSINSANISNIKQQYGYHAFATHFVGHLKKDYQSWLNQV